MYKKRMWKKNRRGIELGNSEFSFSVLLWASGVALWEEILIKIRFFLTFSLVDLLFISTWQILCSPDWQSWILKQAAIIQMESLFFLLTLLPFSQLYWLGHFCRQAISTSEWSSVQRQGEHKMATPSCDWSPFSILPPYIKRFFSLVLIFCEGNIYTV